jgi:hypothetical protein
MRFLAFSLFLHKLFPVFQKAVEKLVILLHHS